MSPEFWLFLGNTVTVLVGALVTIFTLVYKGRKATEAQTVDLKADQAETKKEVDEVRAVVNGQSDALRQRIAELEAHVEHLTTRSDAGRRDDTRAQRDEVEGLELTP